MSRSTSTPARDAAAWPFEVRGLGAPDGKRFPSAGAAIAFAQMRAGQLGASYLVTEWEDVIARVESREGAVVTLNGSAG